MILAIGGSLLFAASMGFAFEFDRRRKRREALMLMPIVLDKLRMNAEEFSRVVGQHLAPAMRRLAEQMTAAAKALRVARVSPPSWEELAYRIEEVE